MSRYQVDVLEDVLEVLFLKLFPLEHLPDSEQCACTAELPAVSPSFLK